mmetsp:Transcript_36406/g.6516  ORF Transcript_36406/g.6516 Transcript_36406/m.6516 type:complete len:92 (+) Transcript_36406:656-931(+)
MLSWSKLYTEFPKHSNISSVVTLKLNSSTDDSDSENNIAILLHTVLKHLVNYLTPDSLVYPSIKCTRHFSPIVTLLLCNPFSLIYLGSKYL